MRHETDSRLGTFRIPRSRGAASGLLLVLLGAWGALVPFIGPYFDFAFTPNTTWTWTSGRFWLEVLPGVATVLGGLVLLLSADRVTATVGGWLAAAAGAWFVVGPALAPLWDPGTIGSPVGGTTRQAMEWLTFFYGLGAVIVFLSAVALGRLSVRGVRDVEAARRYRDRREARREAAAAAAAAPTVPTVPAAPTGSTAPAAPAAPGAPAGHDDHVYPSDSERARLGDATEPSSDTVSSPRLDKNPNPAERG